MRSLSAPSNGRRGALTCALPIPVILPVIIEEAPVKKITSITDIIGDDFRAELDKSFNKQKKFTRGKVKK